MSNTGSDDGAPQQATTVIPFKQPKCRQVERLADFSDDALALRFAHLHAGDLRYVAKWAIWLRWDGSRWQADDTLAVFDSARSVCRLAAESAKPRLAKELTSAKTVAAVERLARSDRRLAGTIDQWDADPWLLNTPQGAIDLRSAGMRAHRADDYLTHITAVAPGGDCPRWHAFLDRVTAGDRELQGYLQRVCGYALTGLTREHALFFLYGPGANGKGTFVNTIAGILGDYHRTAPIETFTVSKTDRHPTDLAGLRGARLVTATETEEGRGWAEAKIKTLTGGDQVSARFMRQDFFDYVPQFKLMISGNHKPGLRSVDEAMRRRFNMLPFLVIIPAGDRDLELADKLRAEAAGILQWMIDGCLAWQREGLNPPAAVASATADYLEAQDSIAAWLNECCDLNPNAWERSQVLFTSWRVWAERSGQFVGDIKTFRDRLDGRDGIDFRKQLTNQARRVPGRAAEARGARRGVVLCRALPRPMKPGRPRKGCFRSTVTRTRARTPIMWRDLPRPSGRCLVRHFRSSNGASVRQGLYFRHAAPPPQQER